MTIDVGQVRDRGFRVAFIQHARVVSALMLRDIQTRFGASYFGFLVGLILPLMHILLVLTVYIMLGRRAPIGTDVMLYLTTAILPFVVWSYTHQKISQAFSQNKALISFPAVRLIDILIARALVEALNATLIICVVATVFFLLEKNVFVARSDGVMLALFLAYLYGISTGFLFGLLSMINPALLLFGFLLIPLNWFTCGIFFIPDGLPIEIRNIVAIFPLSHIVDFGRTSVYSSYVSEYYSIIYVLFIVSFVFFVCLILQHFLKPLLTSK